MTNQGTILGKDRIDQELAEAGWETDGSFSEHLAIGNSGDLCVLVHRSTWETDEPAYELYDVGRNVSYWVHEVPRPTRLLSCWRSTGNPPRRSERF